MAKEMCIETHTFRTMPVHRVHQMGASGSKFIRGWEAYGLHLVGNRRWCVTQMVLLKARVTRITNPNQRTIFRGKSHQKSTTDLHCLWISPGRCVLGKSPPTLAPHFWWVLNVNILTSNANDNHDLTTINIFDPRKERCGALIHKNQALWCPFC